MFVPEGLPVAEDEVLVQVVKAEEGVIELRPRKLNELSLDDMVHATQVLDPSDDEFNEYATSPMAASCLKRRGLHGQTVHIYD
ncbi:hypothetical protein ABZ721_01305 [Streptomyces sp. NPDC006733]|uniref:hypothetical protein n=1 Tax=Streptomyces sp. NPDC006733 TaxID=3155460 RepID=UPI00340A3BF8